MEKTIPISKPDIRMTVTISVLMALVGGVVSVSTNQSILDKQTLFFVSAALLALASYLEWTDKPYYGFCILTGGILGVSAFVILALGSFLGAISAAIAGLGLILILTQTQWLHKFDNTVWAACAVFVIGAAGVWTFIL